MSEKQSAAHAQLELALAANDLDPAGCIFRNVSPLSRSIRLPCDAAFTPLGLTAGRFNLLMTRARGGPLSVGQLAESPAEELRLALGALRRSALCTLQGARQRMRARRS
jgi:hypothetical protein